MGKRGPKPRPFGAFFEMGDGCWEWQGARLVTGYGRVGNGRMAHRVAYELAYGEIPAGLQVMHSCDNPPCVRPDHLSVGTGADNLADMVAKGRSLRGTRNHAAKLDPERVRSIREALAAGQTKAAVARSMRVSEALIYNVAKGLSWGWVE